MPTAWKAALSVPAPFTGFGPRALTFLNELAANQTREWFQANRHINESDIRQPLAAPNRHTRADCLISAFS